MNKAIVVSGMQNSGANLIMALLEEADFPLVSHLPGYENHHYKEMKKHKPIAIRANPDKAMLFYIIRELISPKDIPELKKKMKVIWLSVNPKKMYYAKDTQAYFAAYKMPQDENSYNRFLAGASKQQNDNITFITRHFEHLILSQDDMITNPRGFIKQLLDFVDWEADIFHLEIKLQEFAQYFYLPLPDEEE